MIVLYFIAAYLGATGVDGLAKSPTRGLIEVGVAVAVAVGTYLLSYKLDDSYCDCPPSCHTEDDE